MVDRTTIAMFSGPRNISTTIMRAFENRPDTVVFDEPFYATYLTRTGAPHPMRNEILAAQPNERSAVIAQLAADLPDGATVAFQKHIAFHFSPTESFDWVGDAHAMLLIRDPREMVASYKNKYDDAAPIVESFSVQQRVLRQCEKCGAACPILDASDVLQDPQGMLRALCGRFEIPFHEAMLAWPAGPRPSDGVWGPHWYDAVRSSTGFRAYQTRDIELTPELEAVAARCAEAYAMLHSKRMRI